MQRLVSKMALTLALITFLAFLISGTASAQRVVVPHQASAASMAAPFNICPPTTPPGNAVALAQRILNELYRDFDDPSFWENSPFSVPHPIPVDGIFGPVTQAAVKDFQFWNNLPMTGVVDPPTWHKMHQC